MILLYEEILSTILLCSPDLSYNKFYKLQVTIYFKLMIFRNKQLLYINALKITK